jgi:hypothetical protein
MRIARNVHFYGTHYYYFSFFPGNFCRQFNRIIRRRSGGDDHAVKAVTFCERIACTYQGRVVPIHGQVSAEIFSQIDQSVRQVYTENVAPVGSQKLTGELSEQT